MKISEVMEQSPLVKFRPVNVDDLPILADIYRHSVRQIAPSLYTQQQVNAWSAFAEQEDQFREFIVKPQTYLLEQDDLIIAFSGLETNGHIASLYVHPHYNRQGYGTRRLVYVLNLGEKLGINRFFAEASFFSQPVFSRQDFKIVTTETVYYGDVAFDRYKMEKVINHSQVKENK